MLLPHHPATSRTRYESKMGGHDGGGQASSSSITTLQDGLRKTQPYWYEFQTYAKLRWFGRELIEIMTTEFRDRTKEYYVWAIHKGICTVNGKKADIQQVIGDGDKICNSVHRHEPPVTDEPIKIIHRDDEEGILVIVKPGSIPVHAAGRYLRHTLTGLLKTEHGIEMVYTTNRLDRLTSGIMVCSTKKETASRLGAQFAAGQVSKAYVCRVRGAFPKEKSSAKNPSSLSIVRVESTLFIPRANTAKPSLFVSRTTQRPIRVWFSVDLSRAERTRFVSTFNTWAIRSATIPSTVTTYGAKWTDLALPKLYRISGRKWVERSDRRKWR